MFGYVKPNMPELLVREFGEFRACYCGMCHELQRSFGLPARFILNYDFVFLAMLLETGKGPGYELRRCPVSPIRKRCVVCESDATSVAAACSVILTYHKLRDTIADDGLWERAKARAAIAALAGAYKKAKKALPDFDETVRRKLAILSELEKNGEQSLDRPADAFAALLASAAYLTKSDGEKRVKEQILYHLGRIIYIADAFSDLAEDFKKQNYNPVAKRFNLTSPDPTDEVRESVERTLLNSAAVLKADFELLPETCRTGVLRNIITLGIPDMCRAVSSGEYVPAGKRAPKLKGDTI